MSFLSNAKSFTNIATLGAMLAVGIGLTGCDKDGGDLEPNKLNTTWQINTIDTIEFRSTNSAFGYVGNTLTFGANSLDQENNTIMVDGDLIPEGKYKIKILTKDYIVNNFSSSVRIKNKNENERIIMIFSNSEESKNAGYYKYKANNGDSVKTYFHTATISLNDIAFLFMNENEAGKIIEAEHPMKIFKLRGKYLGYPVVVE